jgi:hypothetical protein
MNAIRWTWLAAAVCVPLAAEASEQPTVTISVGGRTACVTPATKHFARAEDGVIDVRVPAPGVLAANLSGCVAANAYLAHTGAASESFELAQEIEISCSDPRATTCTLTFDSTLVGFIRSKYRASACVKVAAAALTPANGGGSPISIAHQPSCVGGSDGRLCNQSLAPVVVSNVPLGKYVFTAEFVIEAEASGICDAHSAADFSSTSALSPDFVRLRDPFQNADKKNFGFNIVMTATPGGGTSSAPRVSSVKPISYESKPKPARAERPTSAAFERARGPNVH